MPGQSPPYFTAEALIAAMEIMNQRDRRRPLLRLFKRRAYPAAEIIIRKMQRRPNQIRHTTWGGKAMPVERGTIKEEGYAPSVMKLFDDITLADEQLFVAAEKARGRNDVGPLDQAVLDRANARIQRIAKALRDDNAEEMHRMECELLSTGTVNYALGEETFSVDFGLTAIANPSTSWDDIAANIKTDIDDAVGTFYDQNEEGARPTHVLYNPKLVRQYFGSNTEIEEWRQAHESLVAGWFRMASGEEIWDPFGLTPDPVFGLRWIPVEGKYKDLAGTLQERWPIGRLCLLNLEGAAAGDEPNAEGEGTDPHWGMVLNRNNPRPETNVEVKEPQVGDENKAFRVLSFENGLPVLTNPDQAMPWQVIF